MGFLDSLKKILNAADNVSDMVGKISSVSGNFADKAKPAQQKNETSRSEPKKTVIDFNAARERFDRIIDENFASEMPEKNVKASSLMSDCHPACTPIDYLFYKDGEPKLAVVLVKKNTYRGMNVTGTADICYERKIRYMRFFLEMENEPNYVVNRIRAAL